MNGELRRKEGNATPEPEKPDSLTARVASISNRPTGEAIYSLESGQIFVADQAAVLLGPIGQLMRERTAIKIIGRQAQAAAADIGGG